MDRKIKKELKRYIAENYIEERKELFSLHYFGAEKKSEALYDALDVCESSLAQELELLDASFTDSLLEIIRNKELDEVEVYKNANIDRRLFSKIRSDRNYQPSKNTAIALCIGLKLDYDECISLLSKAGYTLSNSSMFDVIVKYFIENKIYDIASIDEALLDYDQKTLSNY